MILVIDDDEVVRDTVVDILGFHSIPVMVAGDGQTGVAIYRIYRRQIVLVLLDFLILGLDSVQARYELAKINPQLRVIVSSGYSESEVLSHFVGMPVAGFIRKPYTASALLDMIQPMLSR